MSGHPPESRKKPPVPLRWFRNVFEPMPPLPPMEPLRHKPLMPPPPAKMPAAKNNNANRRNDPPAPLPIANPLMETPGEKPPPRSLDEVTEAIREVNTAVAALSQLEGTSNHPAKDLIGKVARRSLRDVGGLLQRIQRPKRR